MTTVVVDASFVTALLTDPDLLVAAWTSDVIIDAHLAAPHLMPVEVTSALRRAERQGQLSANAAVLALGDLGDLGIDLFPFEPFAPRVWDVRHEVSPYDAWYVALAEYLDAPLATLDRRLSRIAAAQCAFVLPPT